jgi:PhzF family phenazine biosynthesis protein
MPIPIAVIDSFTDRPFAGNPAAVCFLTVPAEERWMMQVAAEMNLAETAFLVPRGGEWDLRWFTPNVEVDLCGHATLASAHALWDSGRLALTAQARFHTRSGLLTADRGEGWIALDFPNEAPTPCAAPPGLAAMLGAAVLRCGQNRMDLFAEVADERTVTAMTPDHDAISKLPVRGIVVTARADAGRPYDFVSRWFGRQTGIDEDPVTGSAHCGLAPWWRERIGRDRMTGYQASSRGGIVRVTLKGDRCQLEGQAVTIWKGELV